MLTLLLKSVHHRNGKKYQAGATTQCWSATLAKQFIDAADSSTCFSPATMLYPPKPLLRSMNRKQRPLNTKAKIGGARIIIAAIPPPIGKPPKSSKIRRIRHGVARQKLHCMRSPVSLENGMSGLREGGIRFGLMISAGRSGYQYLNQIANNCAVP